MLIELNGHQLSHLSPVHLSLDITLGLNNFSAHEQHKEKASILLIVQKKSFKFRAHTVYEKKLSEKCSTKNV